MKTKCFLLIVLAALLALPGRSHAASGDVYYLSLAQIPGDLVSKGHSQQIPVTGFQFPGISGSATSFYIEKGFDSASAKLLVASLTAQPITSGTFYCEKGQANAAGAGTGRGLRVFTMIFGGLTVDARQSYDLGSADPYLVEKVSFGFSTLSIITYSYDADGRFTSTTTPVFSSPMTN